MQIIERSAFGARAVFYRLEHPQQRLAFWLLPMVHIADPGFYAQAHELLQGADCIVAEGVQDSRVAGMLTAYRFVPKRHDLGLVCQRDALPWGRYGSRLIRGDIAGADFDSGWRRIPLRVRAMIWFGMPIWLVRFMLVGTRQSLVSNLGRDDLPGRRDIVGSESFDGIKALIVDHRDVLLIDVLERLLTARGQESISVAVVWGAAHMPAVLDWLMQKRGFRVVASEWAPVIAL